MIKICCITYKYLDDLVKRAIETINDQEIQLTVVEGLQKEIIEDVQKEITNGAELLLAGGANAKIAENTFLVPVLYYKISDFDYLSAIHKGYEQGSKVAIVTYQTGISPKLKKYLVSQKINIENIIYEDDQDLEREIGGSNIEVIIGASHAVEVGKKFGRKTVLIYPGVQSILDTIHEGKRLALEIRKIKEQNQYANTVIRYTTNGVILIDELDRIIEYNEVVREILGIGQSSLRSREIGSVIPNWCNDNFKKEKNKEKSFILNINGHEILETVVKVGSNPLKFEGAVIILIKLNAVRKAQHNYDRKKRDEKKQRGFEAKKFFSDIIGSSFHTKACIADAKIFAKSSASVLIYGETGVGKELFAQGIHNESLRAKGPFIAINCGALTESLLEAELFGYEEGAFTGSRKGGKKGLFELAEEGTVFLDEIGEISPLLQIKLLRVLQEHEIMRVGGECIIPVDVRVIAATNRDLEHMSHENFRRDLLYRLNVLELRIPPLREREQDAKLLFDAFFQQRVGVKFSGLKLPEDVYKLIALYSWQGNIREMQNVCERFCLYLDQVIKPNQEVMVRYMIKAIGEEKLLKSILSKHHYNGKDVTRELVLELKNTLFYSREKMTRILGVSRTSIWRMLKEENVSKDTKK